MYLRSVHCIVSNSNTEYQNWPQYNEHPVTSLPFVGARQWGLSSLLPQTDSRILLGQRAIANQVL